MMTIDDYAQVLRGPEIRFVEDGFYANKDGRCGYRATYRTSKEYYWYSVSGTEIPIAADEVALAIVDRRRAIVRANPYRNQNGQRGFEATVRSGEHFFMLNAAPDPPSG